VSRAVPHLPPQPPHTMGKIGAPGAGGGGTRRPLSFFLGGPKTAVHPRDLGGGRPIETLRKKLAGGLFYVFRGWGGTMFLPPTNRGVVPTKAGFQPADPSTGSIPTARVHPNWDFRAAGYGLRGAARFCSRTFGWARGAGASVPPTLRGISHGRATKTEKKGGTANGGGGWADTRSVFNPGWRGTTRGAHRWSQPPGMAGPDDGGPGPKGGRCAGRGGKLTQPKGTKGSSQGGASRGGGGIRYTGKFGRWGVGDPVIGRVSASLHGTSFFWARGRAFCGGLAFRDAGGGIKPTPPRPANRPARDMGGMGCGGWCKQPALPKKRYKES